MSEKQRVLTALREEFKRWEELLASLSEAQITAPEFADDWSIKDVVAHLRAWQQRSVGVPKVGREPIRFCWWQGPSSPWWTRWACSPPDTQ